MNISLNSQNINFPGYLTFTSQYNHLGIDTCINLENSNDYNISSQLKELPGFQLYNSEYKKFYYLKENISISDLDKKVYNINNIDIIIPESNQRKARCLILGLNPNIYFDYDYDFKNLPLSIKSYTRKFNSKTYLTILYNFNKKNNGTNNTFLLIGDLPHDIFPNFFDIKNYKEIENYNIKKELRNYYLKNPSVWAIKLDSIYIGNKSYSNETFIGQFSLDYVPFILPMELYRKYLSQYLDIYISKHICEQKGRPLSNKYAHSIIGDKRQTFIFIYCKKNKIDNMTQFYDEMPEINFINNELNKNFVFKGKELFVEEKNYTVLMLMPDMFNKMTITFGRLFMEKYLFCFNYDKNVIGFYDNNYTRNQAIIKNNIPTGIFALLIAILLLGVFFFMIKYFKFKRIKEKNDIIERELIDVNEEKLNS